MNNEQVSFFFCDLSLTERWVHKEISQNRLFTCSVVALLWLATLKTSMGGGRLWTYGLGSIVTVSAWMRKAPVVGSS